MSEYQYDEFAGCNEFKRRSLKTSKEKALKQTQKCKAELQLVSHELIGVYTFWGKLGLDLHMIVAKRNVWIYEKG